MKRYALILTCSLLISQTICAADLYVIPGNDATQTFFQTIQSAVDAAQPGDTVHIAAGVFHETIRLPRSGTTNAPITLAGARTGETIIDGSRRISPNQWKPCGQSTYCFKLASHAFPDAIMLWEDGEQLTRVEGQPTEAGTFTIKDASSLELYPRHPRFTRRHRRTAISTEAPLIATADDASADHIIIDKLTFVRSAGIPEHGAINVGSQHHWILRNLSLQENGRIGVWGDMPHHFTMEATEIAYMNDPRGAGILLRDPAFTTLRDNYIHDNAGIGIDVITDPSKAPPSLDIVDNMLIANAEDNLRPKNLWDTQATIQGNVIAESHASTVSGLNVATAGGVAIHDNLLLGKQDTVPDDTIFRGQFPFVYAPAPDKPSHLTIIRLEGQRGQARVQLGLTPRSKEPTFTELLRATINGRAIPLELNTRGKIIGTARLSPWQNWLVVNVPKGWDLNLVQVDPASI